MKIAAQRRVIIPVAVLVWLGAAQAPAREVEPAEKYASIAS